MYSKKVDAFLQKRKLKVGDRILVTKAGRRTEGLLMPQTEAGDPDTLVIKLDNGYNVGIRADRGVSVSKGRGTGPAAEEEEAEYEMGKTGKELLRVRFNSKKPAISMISVGGTITSRLDYKTGGVTSLSKPAEILHNVPELAKFTNIKNMLMPFNIMSESMNHTHWQALAKSAAKELKKKDIKGVILTHGTDTLHFTSAALSFFLRGLGKPVVITGSQRSSDRGSSDAGMNLICSAHTALSDIAEVGICMHGRIGDDYCIFSRGSKVRKMDTQRRDAFRPINEYPFAKVWPDGRMQVKNRKHSRRDDKKKVELDVKFEPKIALLQAYPGSDPGMVEYLIKKGYKGLVIQATGLGQVPTQTNSWLPVIKRAVDSGIPIFLAAQTLYGRLNNNVYSEGRAVLETGAIPLGDMLPETAYVKLGWALGHTKDMKKVREMMLKNYAGEISSRSLVGTFLY